MHQLYDIPIIWLYAEALSPYSTNQYRVIRNGVTSIAKDTQYGYFVSGYVGICGSCDTGIGGSCYIKKEGGVIIPRILVLIMQGMLGRY